MNCARPTVMKFIFTEAILSGVSIQFHRLMAIRADSSTFIRCSRVSSNYTSISIWPHQIEASVEKHLVKIPISDVITARLLARSVVTVDYVIANTFHTIRRAICFECLFFVFFCSNFVAQQRSTTQTMNFRWNEVVSILLPMETTPVGISVCLLCVFFAHISFYSFMLVFITIEFIPNEMTITVEVCFHRFSIKLMLLAVLRVL